MPLQLADILRKKDYWIAGLVAFGLFVFAKDFPFFWDTIQLGARQALHIYETRSYLLPDAIDSGHPPGFGAYLSLWWRLLGPSVWVSHLAMLPWVCLLLTQLLLIGRDYLGPYRYWLFFLLLLEPVLLTQLLLVSPDVVLIAAYLLGLRQVCLGVAKKSHLLVFAIIILALISSRGWIAALSLYLLEWLATLLMYYLAANDQEEETPSVGLFGLLTALQMLAPFLLGGVLALSYLLLHYQSKAWISYHPDSPWAASFEPVGWLSFLKNIGLVGWRLLDLGRIGLWIALIIAIYKKGWRQLLQNYYWWRFGLGIVLFFLLLLPLILTHTGLTAPRYLLPAIVLFDIWVAYTLLFNYLDEPAGSHKQLPLAPWQKRLFAFCLLCLLCGNFWIYPHRIAQAWDSTPMHLPFYLQEAAAIDFLRQQGISLEDVGSVFPSIGPRNWRQLNGEQNGFTAYQSGQQPYAFVSRIHNDWTNEQLDSLSHFPILWQQTAKNGIWSRIYQITLAAQLE